MKGQVSLRCSIAMNVAAGWVNFRHSTYPHLSPCLQIVSFFFIQAVQFESVLMFFFGSVRAGVTISVRLRSGDGKWEWEKLPGGQQQ